MSTCDCKEKTLYKSCWIKKSPPTEKINRHHTFQTRWCTLGRFRLCKHCADEMQATVGSLSLVFSYFKDESETKLKGKQFCLLTPVTP